MTPLKGFTDALFEPEDIIEVRCLPSRTITHHKASELHLETLRLAKLNEQGDNIYVGANPRKAVGGTKTEDVLLARSLFADFDKTDLETVRRKLAEHGLPYSEPTLILASGHGFHVYWRLTEPITDLKAYNRLMRRLAKKLESDPKVCDIPHVMRLPGFLNIKPAMSKVKAELIEISNRRHRLIDFNGTLPPLKERKPPPPKATTSPRPADLTNIEARAIKYLAACPPAISGAGGHNQTFSVARALVWGFDLSAEKALNLLLAHYNPMRQPPWSENELRHKCQEADSKPFDKPRGYLLNEELPQGKPFISTSAPIEGGSPEDTIQPDDDGPQLINMADVEPQSVSWLWHGRIPQARLSLLVGHAGDGKSFLTIDMAATVSTGRDWPDGSPCQKGSVLLICAEDNPGDTIKPRLMAHGADCGKIKLLKMVRHTGPDKRKHDVLFTLADVQSLEQTLRQMEDCRLIIIDPIGSFIGGKIDSHRDTEVRSILAPIAELAERYGPAVAAVCHRPKARGNRADDLVIGSRAFTGLARTVWHLSRDPQNRERRLLLPGKNNLAKEGSGLAFTIIGEPAVLEWEPEPIYLHADEGLANENNTGDDNKPGPKPVVRNAAKSWLAKLLKNGSMIVPNIKLEAQSAELGWRSVQRAAEELAIDCTKDQFGGNYRWSLPPPA